MGYANRRKGVSYGCYLNNFFIFQDFIKNQAGILIFFFRIEKSFIQRLTEPDQNHSNYLKPNIVIGIFQHGWRKIKKKT